LKKHLLFDNLKEEEIEEIEVIIKTVVKSEKNRRLNKKTFIKRHINDE